MATAEVIQVSAGVVRDLFVALGRPEAAKWSVSRLTVRLPKLRGLVNDDTDLKNEDLTKSAEVILTGLESGASFELIGEDDNSSKEEAIDSDQDSAPVKVKKKAGRPKKSVDSQSQHSIPKKVKKTGRPTKEEAADRKAKGIVTKKKPPIVGAGKGYRIMGHSSTSVIHWLGGKGYDFDAARKVLKYFKVSQHISDINLKARLSVGRSAERAKPASLTKDEVKQIKALVG